MKVKLNILHSGCQIILQIEKTDNGCLENFGYLLF